jgi:hypothetical protein
MIIVLLLIVLFGLCSYSYDALFPPHIPYDEAQSRRRIKKELKDIEIYRPDHIIR